MEKRDYYEVLEVPRDASDQEIKRAYRRAAIRWHPDRNPDDPQAEERFKVAAEAYAVLSDAQKRARYNRFGHDGVGAAGGGFDPGIFSEFQDIFGGAGIFEDLFGAAFGGGARRRRGGAARGSHLRYDLELDFLEAARGLETRVVIPRLEDCPDCEGSGAASAEGVRACPDCGGRGQVRYQSGFFAVTRACSRCRGAGRTVIDPCRGCAGQGRVQREKEIQLRIPPGLETGARLRVSGQGEAGVGGGPPGDLFVVLQVRPHDYFERDGTDIHCRFPISFAQAVLGATVRVPALEGEEELRVPPGTQSGEVLRVRGAGIQSPDGRGRGDQYVHLQVVVPRKLSARQRELIEELGEIDGAGVDAGDKNFFDKVKELFR